MDERVDDLKRRLDELAAEFTDVLASENQSAPICIGVSLVTAWADPTDPEDDIWVRPMPSATTSQLTQIGLLAFTAERTVA